MNACSQALKKPVIGDFLFRDLKTGTANMSFSMYWIPKDEELKLKAERVDKDPILVATVYGRKYLIAQWDVKGELPYQHYLAEFTEKKAGE